MNTKIFGGLLMVAILAITSAAKAGTVVNHTHHNQHNFEHRLKRDVRNGELTKLEAKHYRTEAKRIHEEKRMALAHGTFTAAERTRINNEKSALAHNLRREEHRNNNKVRG